ncbi:saxitoxin and tetrodotoxin-binding protein 1 [Nothobranchius furzeri]|uniref:saxitoxin and tetrodotoxin-binding protein 1 n=1 Tax=Nothobranchius furzeri TaxID=105023 RepID=UPI003904DE0C
MSLCSIMNLWLSGFILFASLFLCSSAPTPEECNQLVKPLSLADPSMMFGKMHFIAGYTNHKVYKAVLKITESSWVNIKASPSSNTQVLMTQENKFGGICLGSTVSVTIDGDTARASIPNINSVFHVLPSCNGCLVFSINSTARHMKELLKLMKIKEAFEDDEIHTQVLYLLSREFTLTDSDLEHFKKQASCLGFSGDPDFRYNPIKTFCQEGEGLRLPHSQDSDPTPEECKQLAKPLSLANPSVMFGRTHLLALYTDHDFYKSVIKMTDSSWVNITASPSSSSQVLQTQENKINGTCLTTLFNMTLDGNTVTSFFSNGRSVSHILPSCDGCLVFISNITINHVTDADEIHTRALYFLGRESTLKDSDLEHFKKQARCFGYSGEPYYRHNPEKGYCQEGEGIKVQY